MASTPSPTLTPALSVVVPVYNEADNILSLLGEIEAVLKGLPKSSEIIFVDDGSSDETQNLLKEAKKSRPALRALRLRANCGQSTALYQGIKAAHAPLVVTLDGDGQNDPADIPRLLALWEKESAPGKSVLVAGVRRRRHDNTVRRLSSRIANAVRGRLLRDDTPDTGCSLKLFEREAFLAYPFFDHMHRFLPALHKRAGGRIVLIGVNHRPRHKGVSKYGVGNRLWVGLADLFGVWWLQHRIKHPVLDHEE